MGELCFFIATLIVLAYILYLPSARIGNRAVICVLATLSLYWGFEFVNSGDMGGYIECFKALNTKNIDSSLYGYSQASFERGFLYFMALSKMICPNFFFFQFLLFSIEILLIFYGLNKFVGKKMALCVMCILFTIYPHFIGVTRQSLACAIVIYSIPFVIDRKYIKVLIIYATGSFFHFSILLMLLFPFLFWVSPAVSNYLGINKFNIFSKPLFWVVILLILDAVYVSGFSLSRVAGDFFEVVEFADASTGREYGGAQTDEIGTSTFGIKKLIELNVCYLLVFCVKWRNKVIAYKICACFFLIYFLLNIVLGGTIVHRIGYYFVYEYYLLFLMAVYNITKNLRLSCMAIYFYLLTLFVIQDIMQGNFIFEYHLFDV